MFSVYPAPLAVFAIAFVVGRASIIRFVAVAPLYRPRVDARVGVAVSLEDSLDGFYVLY